MRKQMRASEEAQSSSLKKATNVSLPAKLVAEAKELGIALSSACERGLREEISERRAQQWREENRAAIDQYNADIEKNGLPLAKYRLF